MPKNLEQLMQQLKQGDMHALEKIHDETHRGVFAILLSLLKDYHAAEDAMQNTYVNVYSGIAGYRDNTNPFAWIATIARNEALQIIRKRKPEEDIDSETLQLAYKGADYEKVEDKTVLSFMLSSLKEHERAIILMHDGAGLKHREIAQSLGKPLGSVLWSYNNAMKKLQKLVVKGGENNEKE